MQNVKLKSFSLRDIRVLKQRKRKAHLKLLKTHGSIYSPAQQGKLSPIKYIDPFQFHRIISDFIVIEDLNKIEEDYFSGLKLLIENKHIAHIEFNEEFVYARFENSGNYPYTPLDLVIARLRSMGNQNAFKLAADILEYKELCLLIKNTKQYGYSKEVLSSFSPKYLNFLKEYFKTMISTTITTDRMIALFKESLSQNRRNPVFFFMYDEYKDYIGADLCGVGVNSAMRRLIDWKEFEICHKHIWCQDKKVYYQYLHRLFDEFITVRDFDQTLFINTRFGFMKITYEVKRYFVAVESKKMVFVICTAKDIRSLDGSPVSLESFLEMSEEAKKEDFEAEQCERSKMWNRLIDCYFDFQKKKE